MVKSYGRERYRKDGKKIYHVGMRETNINELPFMCRKVKLMSKPG